jgi:heptosyltransferase II
MKVMIRVPNWVGDAVMAEPALRQLRRIFNDARITFVARPWVAGLFEGENLYDEVIPAPEARGFLQSTNQFIKEARTLRGEKFDYGVLLTNSFGTALSARASGIRKVAGYRTDARHVLLHLSIPLDADYRTKHQVLYYLNMARKLEEKLSGESQVDLLHAQPRLQATEESQAKARGMLAEAGIEVGGETSEVSEGAHGRAPAQKSEVDSPLSAVGSKESDVYIQIQNPKSKIQNPKIVALNPGATNSRAKQWLAERFAATADALADRDGFQTIIIGAAGDVERAGEVAQLMRTKVANLAGRTSIAELKAVLSLSSVLISNDTGAAHVAAALGVPTVVVFGPTEHFATRPLSDVAAVVRHDVECSPCMLKDCPIDHRCMTRVEVDEVYAAAKHLLGINNE